MAFIDDVIDNVQKAGKIVADKATDVKDFTVLEYKVLSLKSTINDKYKELGKHVYTKSQSGGEPTGKTAELLNELSTLNGELNELLEQVKKYKKTCSACGAHASGSAAFCKKCGTKL